MDSSIFAVNSDVYFLYMIGKLCAKSGYNLQLGIQALNDYYLLIWHCGNGLAHKSQESEASSPLSSLLGWNNSNRIKECIKALLCIGQIYEQL